MRFFEALPNEMNNCRSKEAVIGRKLAGIEEEYLCFNPSNENC